MDTDLAIALERLQAIENHAHRAANGAFRRPGKRETALRQETEGLTGTENALRVAVQ